MSLYDEELHRLHQERERKRQLESMTADLRDQQTQLAEKTAELERTKLAEQADVDRLEGRSLAAFFYGVVGKMDEKLTQERAEAYAARVKYDAAARELASVEEDLERKEAELSRLEGCEARYEEALRRKREALKASGSPAAGEILRLEERISGLVSQEKEIQEAICAGQGALATTDRILQSLDSADGWATWDLFGGGLIADLAKHDHLDNAQAAVEQLQVQLRRFRTELVDVGDIQADLHVSIDGFLQFADIFFDGLFADWAVMDQINQSQQQVSSTRSQIAQVLSRLEQLLWSVQAEQSAAQTELDALVLDAGLEP